MDNEKRIRARDTTEFLKLIITISISTLIHFPIPDHLPINLGHLASCIDEYVLHLIFTIGRSTDSFSKLSWVMSRNFYSDYPYVILLCILVISDLKSKNIYQLSHSMKRADSIDYLHESLQLHIEICQLSWRFLRWWSIFWSINPTMRLKNRSRSISLKEIVNCIKIRDWLFVIWKIPHVSSGQHLLKYFSTFHQYRDSRSFIT